MKLFILSKAKTLMSNIGLMLPGLFKIKGSGLLRVFLLAGLLSPGWLQAQVTMTVVPEEPTGKDWLTIDIQNFERDVCVEYHNLHVARAQRVGEQEISLVDFWESPPCMLPAFGSIVSFSVPPLYPGEYKVSHGECPYDSGRPTCIDPFFQDRGVIKISDPSGSEAYRLERTYVVCQQGPCPAFRAMHVETGDSINIDGVKDTTGLIVNPYTRDIKWWEGGVKLRGYIHEDSLEGWSRRGRVFAITGVAGSVPIRRMNNKVFPFEVSFSPGERELSIAFISGEDAKTVQIFTASGKLLQRDVSQGEKQYKVKLSDEPSGILLIQVDKDGKRYFKKWAWAP